MDEFESDDDWVELPDDVDAKKLDSKERKALGSDKFAAPSSKKLPINDANHVRNALARFNQTKGLSPAEKSAALAKIHRAAKKFGIKVDAAESDDVPLVQAMSLMAMSLEMPAVDDHPNRMPFTGILTRLDVPSDNPPHGTGGKKIILTRAAAEQALPSLLGMGVDLKHDFTGHSAQNKVGIITAASIDGDAINITGFIYCSDFPKEALRIQLNKADLGFSFEASNLAVASMADNPLTITKLSFTGAAILLKNEAAYTNTALAAAKAKEHEMDEIQEAVTKAVAAALEPLEAKIAAQAAEIDELKKTPEIKALEANRAMVEMCQPHIAACHAAADGMENNSPPIGMGVNGHVSHLRRIASHLGSEAANGRLPANFSNSGSAWAGADPTHQQAQHTEDDDVIIKDTPEFKELKASADKTAADLTASQAALAATNETLASMQTMLKDLKAQMDTQRAPPERKTVPPAIQAILARNGLADAAGEANGGAIPIAKIDAALAGLDTSQRMRIKTDLRRAGVIDFNDATGAR